MNRLPSLISSLFDRTAIRAFVLRESIISFLILTLGTGASFGVRLLIARSVDIQIYGDYDYALSWITGPLLIIAVVGFDQTALRFLGAYRGQDDGPHLRGFILHARRQVFIASLIVGACMALVAYVLPLRVELRDTLLVAAVILLLNGQLLLLTRELLALKNVVGGQGLYFLVRPIILIVIVLGLSNIAKLSLTAVSLMGIYGAISLGLVGFGLGILNTNVVDVAGQSQPAFERSHWNMVAFHLLLISGFSIVVSRTDVAVLGIFRGTTEAGIYSTGASFATLINYGLVAVNSIMAPTISELYAQSRLSDLQRAVTTAAYAVLLYVLVMSLLIALLGKTILGLFGPAFEAAYLPLLILMIGTIVNSLAGPVGFLLTMTKHQQDATIIFGIGALASIFLNVLLVPTYGMLGAAIATSVATVLWNVLMLVRVRKLLPINPTVFTRL